MNKKILIPFIILTSFFFISNVKADPGSKEYWKGNTISVNTDNGTYVIPNRSDTYSDFFMIYWSETNYFVYWYNYVDKNTVKLKINNSLDLYVYSKSVAYKHGNQDGMYEAFINEKEDSFLWTFWSGIPKIIATTRDLYSNDEVYKKANVSLSPKISLLRSENEVLANEILSTTIYIKFSIFDTSKYTYYWKSKLETEWNEITDDLYNGIDGTDEFDYTSTFNDTVYFKVVRNSDNEVVSALTHTFANISEKMPYVTFTSDVPDYCNVNGVTACKGVRAHIINYDPLRHNAYYSLDDETFEPFYPNIEDDYEVYQVFTHNTNWHLKFEDKVNKKKVLFSFNVKGVSSEYDTSTPNVKFEDKLRKVKDTNGNFSHYVMDVNAFIYAFNTDNYNYYYSTDSGQNFQELRDYSVYATDIVKVPFIFKDDARLIIRVTDKNGNLVNDFPYQIEFTKKVEETDKQDNFLTKIFNSAKQKFPIFDQMYNLYKTYLGMEFKDEKPPIPKVNLSFLGINQEYEVIDYTFYDKYRETAFNFVKLGLAIYTMLKLYKIVKSYFGGGK